MLKLTLVAGLVTDRQTNNADHPEIPGYLPVWAHHSDPPRLSSCFDSGRHGQVSILVTNDIQSRRTLAPARVATDGEAMRAGSEEGKGCTCGGELRVRVCVGVEAGLKLARALVPGVDRR